MADAPDFDALAAAAELDLVLGADPAGDDRLAAEVARALARVAREGEREVNRRVRAVLVDLIGVLDDLERALAAGRGPGQGTALLAGIELVERGFLAALARHGVTRVEALGLPFDPAHHEGVSMVPATATAPPGHVVAVLRSGYRLGGELLRAATVVIAKPA